MNCDRYHRTFNTLLLAFILSYQINHNGGMWEHPYANFVVNAFLLAVAVYVVYMVFTNLDEIAGYLNDDSGVIEE